MAKIAGVDAFHPFVCGLVDADEVEEVEVEAEEAEEHDEAVQDEHHGAQHVRGAKLIHRGVVAVFELLA